MEKVMIVGTKEVLMKLLESTLKSEYDVHTCDYSASVFKRYMKLVQPKLVVCFKPMSAGGEPLCEVVQEAPETEFMVVLEKEDTMNLRMLDERVKRFQKPIKIDTMKSFVQQALGAEQEEKPSILAVDDSGMQLRNLKQMIGKEYDLTFATSGDSALRLLEERKFDLILLDYEMPLMSGSEFFKIMQKNVRIKDIPVVFLTGVSDKGKILEVVKERPAGYLLKPIDGDVLLSTIKKVLGK